MVFSTTYLTLIAPEGLDILLDPLEGSILVFLTEVQSSFLSCFGTLWVAQWPESVVDAYLDNGRSL